MSELVKPSTGARAMPAVAAERAWITGWLTTLVCDADLRARSAEYRSIAAQLQPVVNGVVVRRTLAASDGWGHTPRASSSLATWEGSVDRV